MWSLEDNQDVGLEAATIQRVRNSSLVERLCAENVTGLSHVPKLGMRSFAARGRRAFPAALKVYRKGRWSAGKRVCRN